MRTTTRLAVVIPLAVAPLTFASTAVVAADAVVGETAAPSTTCGGLYTVLQTASVATSYVVPTNGIITSVRMGGSASSTPATRAFRLARASGSGYTIVGRGDQISIAQNTTSNQAVRIATRAGDILGFYLATTSECDSAAASSNKVSYFTGDVALNSTASAISTYDGYRLTVAATVEPDADGDGYGDTTQDKCPTQASNQGLCNFSFGLLGGPVGRAKVGKTLSAPALYLPGGSPLPAGSSETYQWYRSVKVKKSHSAPNGVKRKPIPGATGATYKLKKKDRGKGISITIVASNPGYNTEAVRTLVKKVR